MQIETLKVFCDLVESRSFSQAALRNFVTQSAVSQQIKNLESKFEKPLLDRGGRGVTPTEAGRVVYLAAREILDRFERMNMDENGLDARRNAYRNREELVIEEAGHMIHYDQPERLAQAIDAFLRARDGAPA